MLYDHDISIVVLDDEQYICNIIQEALGGEKYSVRTFCDPAEGLRYIENNSVDLVLTDLVMGDFSGMQVLDASLGAHEDAVVILMTAHPTVETAIAVLKRGAYDFLVKPFKLDVLRATIKRGLERQRLMRDNVQLKGQIEFLKVANASVSGNDIESFFELVVQSGMAELSARAAAVLEVNPDGLDIVRSVYKSDSEESAAIVTSENTLLDFSFTKSRRPVIKRENITVDGAPRLRTLISQPVYVRRKLHAVLNVLVISKFDELTGGMLNILKILSNSAASAISNYRLYQDLQGSYLQAIKALAKAIEARDEYTAGHTDRVCRLAEAIARELEWDEDRITQLVMGCTLHDIGKIGVPDAILNKPSGLTSQERKKMIAHPMTGFKIIQDIDLFRPAVPYILAHHEWYDGTGYPKGLKEDEIPIEGRLLAVADTFDAILSDRPYRKGGSLEKAVTELRKYAGKQFDPTLVDAFFKALKASRVDLTAMYKRKIDLSILENEELTTAPETASA